MNKYRVRLRDIVSAGGPVLEVFEAASVNLRNDGVLEFLGEGAAITRAYNSSMWVSFNKE